MAVENTQEKTMGHKLSKITLGILSATALNMAASAHAQEAEANADQDVEGLVGVV